MRAVVICLVLAACGGDAGNSVDAAPGADGSNCETPTLAINEVFALPNGAQARWLDFIASASASLDVHMYLFTIDSLEDALVAAHRRGVAVRVILDYSHEGNADVRAALTAADVPTHDAPALWAFAHAKYLVADGARALVMSANFNYGALDSERNYGFVASGAAIAQVTTIFDADWNGTGGVSLPCTDWIISPNNARPRILNLIASTATTLDLELFYLSDTDVIAAVRAAIARGVSARVLLADDTQQPENAAVGAELEEAGADVRFANDFDVHAKLIVADGAALVGSHNMSNTSLSRNRELGAVVPAAQAAPIRTQFDADWAASQ